MPKKNITIQKIVGILIHRLPMIILSGILVALIFFVYTSVSVKPVYSTSAMIYVQNYGKQAKKEDPAEETTAPTSKANSSDSASQSNNEVAQKIFNSDLAGSAALASNCVILFQNSPEITQYYDGCSVGMSVIEGSFYINISVSGNDPQKCANVANIVADKCAEVFAERFLYGTTGVIREAYTPSSPISPNKMQSALIGGAVGVVIACVIAILLELIDTTIKSDDDLMAQYKIPVFAEIPDFENSGR